MQQFDGTTIVSVRRGEHVAIGGDGQVTLGNTIIKATARKVRKLYNNQVLAGFAGGTADAFTLIELFESKLQKHQGKLMVAAIELAKEWRTDRALRRLEAMLIVADKQYTLIITGNGDVGSAALKWVEQSVFGGACAFWKHNHFVVAMQARHAVLKQLLGLVV